MPSENTLLQNTPFAGMSSRNLPAHNVPRPDMIPSGAPVQAIPSHGTPPTAVPHSHDEQMFCMQCGAGHTMMATRCPRCDTPVTMSAPVTVRHLMETAQSDTDKDRRVEALQILGRLKARHAIPLLLDFDRNRRGQEAWQAKLALTQILDFTVDIITCSACGNDNPATAQFCHGCGRAVVRATVTSQEFQNLIKRLESSGQDFPLDAVQKLGQLQSQAAVPALLALYKRCEKGLKDHPELLIILEALVHIGDSSAVKIATKLASGYNRTSLLITLKCHEALAHLGKRAEALRSLRSLCSPEREDASARNLRYVVQLGQLGEAEDIARLSGYIVEEKRRWRPGIGYLIMTFDPIGFLITTTLSVAYNVIGRVISAQQGKNNAAWMVSTDDLIPERLEKLPGQVRQMIALHCYSTALSDLGQRHLTVLQDEWRKRKKPLECAVLGLALAQNEDVAVAENLKALRADSDWSVRILAYEGLIALAQQTEQIAVSLCLRALQDQDLRVRIAIARILADTRDPAYVSPILAAANVEEKKQRQALTNGDPDSDVRNLAQTHLRTLA